jgi:tetratricopeptide (TPR) repeat protein
MIKKAVKHASTRGLDLTVAIANEGGPRPVQIRETLGESVRAELWRLAGHESAWWQFADGFPEESQFDLSVVSLDLRLDVEFLVVDIAGRESNWTILDQVFPDRLAVLVSRAACRRYFDADPGQYAEEQSLLVLIDGENDVEEVIQQSPMDPFHTLRLLHRFQVMGEVRELNPAELIHVALNFKMRGRFDKCLRLYLRAETLGNQAFDLDLTIGSIYETIGQKDQAFNRYLTFAEKCLNAGERGTGTEAFRRAIGLKPERNDVREKFLQMLDPVEDRVEYLKQVRTFADLARTAGEDDRVLQGLMTLIKAGAATGEELQEYIQVETHKRGPREAFDELFGVAQVLLDDERDEDAAPVLQAAAKLRPESLEIQEALARTYRRLELREPAVDAMNTVARLVQAQERSEEARHQRLTEVYSQLIEVDPNHVAALRFLAGRARKDEDAERSIEYYLRLKTIYQEADDQAGIVHVLSQLIKLKPDEAQFHLEYAECEFASGRRVRAAESLREAATRLAENEHTLDRAVELYGKVLEELPFDRLARRGLAEVHERLGDRAAACEQWERLAEIALAAGDPREAVQTYDLLINQNPEESDYIRRSARAWLALLPDDKGAVDRLEGLLTTLVQLQDYGFVRWLIQQSGDETRFKPLLELVTETTRDRPSDDEVARLRMLRRQRGFRAVKALRKLRDKLRRSETELEVLQSKFDNWLQEARQGWEKEVVRILGERDKQVGAQPTPHRKDDEPDLKMVTHEDTEDDELPGLGGGIKKMETTFNLPSSIWDIAKRLKNIQ